MIPDLRETILNTWRTNNRVTVFLVEHLLAGLWTAAVPGGASSNGPDDRYFVAHEAHHRGQIVVVARALGQRLPTAVTDGLWQWTKRAAGASSEQR